VASSSLESLHLAVAVGSLHLATAVAARALSLLLTGLKER
jgi:hypothetical protein